MNRTIITLTTSIVAATSVLAPAAQAGGLRLGLGFPIGVLVAGAAHQSYEAQRYEYAKKRAMLRAQQAEAARLHRQRALAAAAAAKKAAAEAAAEKQAQLEAAAASEAAAAARKKAVAAALAQRQQARDVGAVSSSGPATPTVAQTTPAPVKTAANTGPAKIAPTATEPETARLDCKRYFANVGMTISVPCTD